MRDRDLLPLHEPDRVCKLMTARAQSGGGEVRRPTTAAVGPVGSQAAAEGSVQMDEVSIIVVPTAALDAALELGKRLGGLPVAGVIGLALRRLAEDADRRGL